MANVDLFDVYFRRADLDRDGRISGNEAVTFFQASGLPKNVLAQIWTYADQNRIGFLGRAEFYNALKLVTVAQSKRELTTELVKAALYGPASAKIPAPKINLSAVPAPQSNAGASTPAPHMGVSAPAPSQTSGLRGPQVPPNVNANQQYMPGSAPRPVQGVPGQGFVGGGGGTIVRPHLPNSAGTNSQISNRGFIPPITQVGAPPAAARPPRPPAPSALMSSETATKDSKVPNASGNGFASGSFLSEDAFAATPSQIKQQTPAPTFSAGNAPVHSASGTQPVGKTSQPAGSQLHSAHEHMKQAPPVAPHITYAFTSSGIPRGPGNSVSSHSQMPWPKVTQSNVQKYTKVFLEVDTDRDGKITGEQARNLFLSWRLPREILKQVWDLSDQDNDSMLSLREFCIALYLMERFREGRPLPSVLPTSIMLDFPATVQPAAVQGNAALQDNAAWRPASGWQHQQVTASAGMWEKPPAAERRQPLQVLDSEANKDMQKSEKKSKVPVLEKHLVDQLSKEEQELLNSRFKEAADAEKKVEESEKEILESRQKIQFYSTKMQELVLYKSRCDNRLNEIMERTSADRHEVELLAKKYEEKYKQSGDVASKLTIEESTFRDIQEKKMELYKAIVKMEQGGSADGVIQARADSIQSDIDKLVKALNDRCKKYGLRARPTAVVELPFGWQPGLQEGAADWDESWDNFEDEGYYFVKELTLDVKNVIAPPKSKSTSFREDTTSQVESPRAATLLAAEVMSDKSPSAGKEVHENGSRDNLSDADSVRSAPESPAERNTSESIFRDIPDSHFVQSTSRDGSPLGKEAQSEHEGGDSFFSGDKGYDEPAWGTFDNNDDLDSVWGFNAGSNAKEFDIESHRDNYYFDSGELGLNPIKTGSADSLFPKRSTFAFDESVPSTPADSFFPKRGTFAFDESVPSTPADSFFPKRSTFAFDESVPSTPMYNENSPPKYSFDNFSRFDSFNTQDSAGFFQPQEKLSRFDSMRSTSDFDHGRETFTRFDSIRSSADYNPTHGFSSFDDQDPFGSTDPFKISFDSQTPRTTGFDETPRTTGTDKWSAF